MKYKKGIQLNQAVGAVLALILIAVLVIVSIFMFSSLGTTMLAVNTAGSVANESGYLNSTGYTLARSTIDAAFASPVIVTVLNATSNNTIASGNYTLTGNVLTNATATTWSSVRITYTYTYSASTSASNASDTMISNFSNYPALVGLVGTIIFLGIVIGVLVASFVFGGRNEP